MNEQELKAIEDRCTTFAKRVTKHIETIPPEWRKTKIDWQTADIITNIPALIAEVRRLQENAKFFSCAWCKEQAEPHIFEMSEHGGYDEQGRDICDGCSEAAEWGP